jgi:hypothetical protein
MLRSLSRRFVRRIAVDERRLPTQYAPLALYAIVYLCACLVGALILLWHVQPLVAWFELFNGTTVPALSVDEIATDLRLLICAPLLFAAGYVLGITLPVPSRSRRLAERMVRNVNLEPPWWLPHVFFYTLALIALVTLVHAGSLSRVGAWTNYYEFVNARGDLFAQINFIGFVNIYLFVPTAAAWAVISTPRSTGVFWRGVRWSPLVMSVLLALLLFQKKAAVVTLVIIISAVILRHGRGGRRFVRRGVVFGVVAVLVVYFAAVIAPAYSTVSTSLENTVERHYSVEGTPAIVAYTMLAPLTRTAAPALYYPYIYPRHHPFYGLDVGQDVLGFGQFPDDNIVVWNSMNPGLPGSSAAPFQFSLYSQIGLKWTLMASPLVGTMLALWWRLSLAYLWPSVWRSLLGSLTILLSIYLGIESVRNSLTVSYGVGWGILFVVCAALATAFVNKIGAMRAARRVPQPSERGR